MNDLNEIKELLNLILISEIPEKSKLVKLVQEKIWNEDSITDEKIINTLEELAYDLDFYEPDPFLRKEDISFWGEDRLENLIKNALKEL